MFDAMSTTYLAKLLHIPHEVLALTIDLLQSVLNVPAVKDEPVRIFHPSFRDFILNRERCSDERLGMDKKDCHITLFRNCLQVMSKLHQNVCGLQDHGVLVSDIPKETVHYTVPIHIRYACCYWVYHFQQGNSEQEDIDRILRFLNEHFLHWLEALSLFGEVSEGVCMVTSLEVTLTVSHTIIILLKKYY